MNSVAKNWLEIILAADTPDLAEQFEAAFWQTGALSVTLTSQNEEVILVEPRPGDMPQWDKAYVTGLYPIGTDPDEIIGFLSLILNSNSLPIMKSNALEDREWETEWQTYFEPIGFGCNQSLWVCPTTKALPDSAPIDRRVIHLDPGLAFGTGTHATTSMVLSWLADHDVTNQVVVDYGCGSGILGIGAARCGAVFCVLNDIDQNAIEAARDNCKKNTVSDQCVVCAPNETVEMLIKNTSNHEADIVIANILLAPILNLRETLLALCKDNGRILLTGLLNEQVEQVITHYQNLINTKLTDISVVQSGDWSLISAYVDK